MPIGIFPRSERVQNRVLKYARQAETEELRRSILRAYDVMQTSMSESEIHRLLDSGASIEDIVQQVADLPDLNSMLTRTLGTPLSDTTLNAARTFSFDLPTKASREALKNGVSLLNPKVIEGLAEVQGRVFTRMSRGTQEVFRQHLARGLKEGRGLGSIARSARGVIGLAPNQERAVANFERMLRKGDHEVLGRKLRDRRFDNTLKRALGKDGTGLSEKQVQSMTGAYRRRMLQYNADLQTRSAALEAVRRGQRLSWEDAIDRGLIKRDECWRRRNTVGDSRVRPAHDAMNGETRPLDEPYSNGELVVGDTEYNCRCTETYFTQPAKKGKKRKGRSRRIKLIGQGAGAAAAAAVAIKKGPSIVQRISEALARLRVATQVSTPAKVVIQNGIVASSLDSDIESDTEVPALDPSIYYENVHDGVTYRTLTNIGGSPKDRAMANLFFADRHLYIDGKPNWKESVELSEPDLPASLNADTYAALKETLSPPRGLDAKGLNKWGGSILSKRLAGELTEEEIGEIIDRLKVKTTGLPADAVEEFEETIRALLYVSDRTMIEMLDDLDEIIIKPDQAGGYYIRPGQFDPDDARTSDLGGARIEIGLQPLRGRGREMLGPDGVPIGRAEPARVQFPWTENLLHEIGHAYEDFYELGQDSRNLIGMMALKNGDLDFLTPRPDYAYTLYDYGDLTELVSSSLPAMILSPYQLARDAPDLYRYIYAHVLRRRQHAGVEAAGRQGSDLRPTGAAGGKRRRKDDLEGDVEGGREAATRARTRTETRTRVGDDTLAEFLETGDETVLAGWKPVTVLDDQPDLLEFIKGPYAQTAPKGHGDQVLVSFLRKRDSDNQAWTPVDPDEFDRLGGPVYYRAVDDRTYVDSNIDGTAGGRGFFGNGQYFSKHLDEVIDAYLSPLREGHVFCCTAVG